MMNSLVHHYWVWYVLLQFPRWFIITGYCTFCCPSLAGSSLLGMIRFVALPSLVHHYCVCYVLFHFPYWFIITGYGTFCCTSFAGSSLLGMVRFVALPSLVHHYWVWNVLLFDEPAREVQQNVPYPVMMNQRGKCNKTYHTK
jgi:hypothetical protein